jgi:hypothetical protein
LPAIAAPPPTAKQATHLADLFAQSFNLAQKCCFFATSARNYPRESFAPTPATQKASLYRTAFRCGKADMTARCPHVRLTEMFNRTKNAETTCVKHGALMARSVARTLPSRAKRKPVTQAARFGAGIAAQTA